jgi:hypothetical protein
MCSDHDAKRNMASAVLLASHPHAHASAVDIFPARGAVLYLERGRMWLLRWCIWVRAALETVSGKLHFLLACF